MEQQLQAIRSKSGEYVRRGSRCMAGIKDETVDAGPLQTKACTHPVSKIQHEKLPAHGERHCRLKPIWQFIGKSRGREKEKKKVPSE